LLADSKIDDRFPHHHRFRLHFDVKSIPADEKLKAAELQLTRDALSQQVVASRSSANRTRYQVLVYDITRVGVRGQREPSYLLLDTKTVRLNSTDTVSLDVQPAVDRWLASPGDAPRNNSIANIVRCASASGKICGLPANRPPKEPPGDRCIPQDTNPSPDRDPHPDPDRRVPVCHVPRHTDRSHIYRPGAPRMRQHNFQQELDLLHLQLSEENSSRHPYQIFTQA